MCQLSFVNFKNADINAAWLHSQALINTEKDHKDGIGFYGSKLIKYLANPWESPSFVDGLYSVKTAKPMIMHVRKASFSLQNKFLDAQHAHPFRSDNFIFAHNGTLEFKNEKEDENAKYKNMIDSQKFLLVLDEEYEKDKDISASLQRSMDKFYGKFAFLLFDKNTKKYYTVRGSIATLFFLSFDITRKDGEVETSGYVINTERDCLEKNIKVFSTFLRTQNLFIDTKKILDGVRYILPEKLIELRKDDIAIVGEVKENIKPVKYVPDRNYNVGYNYYTNRVDKSEDEFSFFTKNLLKISELWNVSIPYIDCLCLLWSGKSMLSLNAIEFREFIDILLKIESRGYRNSLHTKMWLKILSKAKTDFLAMKDYPELSIPYFMNPESLREVYYKI